jgi:hypothetical protein
MLIRSDDRGVLAFVADIELAHDARLATGSGVALQMKRHKTTDTLRSLPFEYQLANAMCPLVGRRRNCAIRRS